MPCRWVLPASKHTHLRDLGLALAWLSAPAYRTATGKQTVAKGCSWPSLTAERATTNCGNAIDSGRRWLERPLYDAPLPLVANNWPALDDPSAHTLP